MNKICILGSGSWGTAIAAMLSKKGYEVALWSYLDEEAQNLDQTRIHPFLKGDPIPPGIFISSNMARCVEDAEVVVIATPSHTVRGVARNLSNHVKPNQIIVNISKGFEDDTLKRLSQAIEEENPHNTVAVLTGPSHAEEVYRALPTTVVVACKDESAAQRIQDIFMTPEFRVYTNPDVIGVEIGGAFKNVIALCAGITDGLGFGDNTKAAIITRGIAEIARIGIAMGAKIETFYGLAGIGDLIVTCTSPHSRNRRAGMLIGQGKSVEDTLAEVQMVVEGVRATAAAHTLSQRYNVEMPITQQAYKVLFEGEDPRRATTALMEREKRHEAEKVTI